MTVKTIVLPSNIAGAGRGMFAIVFIPKGAEVCTYGGRFVDPSEIKYTFVQHTWWNFKLDGAMSPTHISTIVPGKAFVLNSVKNETKQLRLQQPDQGIHRSKLRFGCNAARCLGSQFPFRFEKVG